MVFKDRAKSSFTSRGDWGRIWWMVWDEESNTQSLRMKCYHTEDLEKTRRKVEETSKKRKKKRHSRREETYEVYQEGRVWWTWFDSVILLLLLLLVLLLLLLVFEGHFSQSNTLHEWTKSFDPECMFFPVRLLLHLLEDHFLAPRLLFGHLLYQIWLQGLYLLLFLNKEDSLEIQCTDFVLHQQIDRPVLLSSWK